MENPYGESRWRIPMENPYGESLWRIPMENPCSCKLTVPDVRAPPHTAGTVLQHNGPDHLGLWCHALSAHRMALITSDCV